jgi:hypothetical protein
MLICKPFRQGMMITWVKGQQPYENNKILLDYGNCKDILQFF